MDEVSAIAARLDQREQGGPRGPWTVEIYPTLVCNLACGFCDTTIRTHRDPHELSPARQLALVDEAASLGAQRVMVLGGGEPLLAPHTPELLRRIKSQGMAGMLTTNATLLSPAVRALLVEIGWDEVHISLDGATPATHDRMRGRAGAFRRSVAATCRLRSLRDQRGQGLPKIVIHTVLTRFNVAELSGLVRLAAAVGAESVELDALVVYQEEQAEFALSPADDAALPARIEAALTVAKQVGVATNFQRFLSPESRDRGNRRPEAGPGAGLGRAPCLKPWHHLVVAANGHLSPCCVLAGEGESVADTSLAAVWEGSPYLQNLRTQMLTGVPAGRCAECSENILVHERNIRAALAPSAP